MNESAQTMDMEAAERNIRHLDDLCRWHEQQLSILRREKVRLTVKLQRERKVRAELREASTQSA